MGGNHSSFIRMFGHRFKKQISLREKKWYVVNGE